MSFNYYVFKKVVFNTNKKIASKLLIESIDKKIESIDKKIYSSLSR